MNNQGRSSDSQYLEGRKTFRFIKRFLSVRNGQTGSPVNRYPTVPQHHIEISQGLGYPKRSFVVRHKNCIREVGDDSKVISRW